MSLRNAVLTVVVAAAVAALALVAMRGDSGAPDLGERAGGEPPRAAAGAEARTADTDTDVAPELVRTPGATSAPEPTSALRGRVLDARGFPVADARVFVDDARSRRRDAPLAQATTDRAGTYVLPAVPAATESFWLNVRHDRHPPFARLEAAPGDAEDPVLDDVRLGDPGTITGLVTTTDGVPVPGATVTPRAPMPTHLRLARDRSELQPPAETGPDGTFRLAPLAPGRYQLDVAAPRMELRRAAATLELGEGEEIDAGTIRLGTATEVRGVVADASGVPLPGARVVITTDIRNGAVFRGSARSDSQGRFAVDHVPLRTVEIVASLTGYLTWRDTRDAAQTAEFWIRLDPGIVLEGTVVDAATGTPIESYAARPVRLRDLPDGDDLPLEAQERRARAGLDPGLNVASVGAFARRVPRGLDPSEPHPDGVFRFEGLDAGVHAVDVRAPGFAFARSEPVELRPGAGPTRVVVALERGFRVAGVVVDAATGEPIASARVDLALPAGATGGENPFARVQRLARPDGTRVGAMILGTGTDGDGAFTFEDVEAGEYVLAARDPDRLDTIVGPIHVAADTPDVRIELSPGAMLHGLVTNHADAGAEGARVLAFGGAGRLRLGQVEPDGSYEIRGLEPGPWVVRACVGNPIRYLSRTPELLRARDPAALPADVLLGPDEQRRMDLTIEIPATGDVVGEVSENGAMVHGARVWIPGLRTGRTDENGRFAFRGVPAAPLDVHVGLPDSSGMHVQSTVVVPDRETSVRFQLATGALRARVVPGGEEPAEGSATFLPGATEPPANLGAFTRAGNPAFTMRVSEGGIEAAHLPAGPGLLLVRCGAASGSAQVVIPRAGTAEVEVTIRAESGR